MLNIAVIGAGDHSRHHHLPALDRYASEHPGAIRLAAFCDIRRDAAEAAAREFGFEQVYTDVGTMLDQELLDGCIAVTPVTVTGAVARRVIEHGIGLLLEKPPGATPEEARAVADLAAQASAPVMVSMNRRFDPALAAARDWIGGRNVCHVRASMLRHNRTESEFITDTAIHAVDTLRWLAGNISGHTTHARQVEGVWWFSVQVSCGDGVTGLLDVCPSCGCLDETYELAGEGFRVVVSTGGAESGRMVAWQDGKEKLRATPTDGMPMHINDGTSAETAEFLTALRDGRVPSPAPRDVLQSVELCHRLLEDAATAR